MTSGQLRVFNIIRWFQFNDPFFLFILELMKDKARVLNRIKARNYQRTQVDDSYQILVRELLATFLILFLFPSDNVQHDLQHRSLITSPKEENLGNKRKPMHQVSSSN